MDTFIDKIAQKRNAQEMIRANMTAEVVKMGQMQEQVQEHMQEQIKAYDEHMQEQIKPYDEHIQGQIKAYDEHIQEQIKAYDEHTQEQMKTYDEFMQEIRQVNLRTAANVSEVQEVLKECISRLETLQTQQASKKAEEAEINGKELAQIRELLEEKFKQSDDFLHRENVKVYRNVQAAVAEELSKQTEELKRSQIQNRGSRAIVPISVLILIGVIADILIKLFAVTIPIR